MSESSAVSSSAASIPTPRVFWLRRRLVRVVVAAFGALAVLAVGGTLFARSARAAPTITVTTCDYSHLSSAIAGASSGDTVNLHCASPTTISFSIAIFFSKSLTIESTGSAVTLDGGGTSQILSDSSGSLTVKHLTFSNGSAFYGGAIFAATLTADHSTFSTNSAFYGGAIYTATLTADHSTFSTNTSGDAGGAIFSNGALSVTDSTFTSNTATNFGGALISVGNVTALRSTFNGNTSVFGAGGGIAGYSNATVTNSTFVNNSDSYYGGAIFVNGSVTAKNSTFVGNTATYGAYAIYGQVGLTLANTALDDAPNCSTIGTRTDNGGNASSDNTCGLAAGESNVAFGSTFGALASNGGPTQTVALLVGNPAIGVGLACPATDQRGQPRPATDCDAGAYQLEASLSLTNPGNGLVAGQPTTLTATLTLDNGQAAPGGNVNFIVNAGPPTPEALTGLSAAFTSGFPAGGNSVTANYALGPHKTLTTVQNFTVSPASTTTLLSALPTSSVYGQPVTFTATVTRIAPATGIPGGSVVFVINGNPSAPVALDGTGKATFTATLTSTPTLMLNSNSVQAQYQGDSNDLPSNSNTLPYTVSPAPTTTTLTANPTAGAVYGQTVTFTATVTRNSPATGIPGGSVVFAINGFDSAPVPLNGSGQATYTSTLSAFPHLATADNSVQAFYLPDANDLASQSNVLRYPVSRTATTTVVTVTPVSGRTVTITVTVTANAPGAGVPTGYVVLSDLGKKSLGTLKLNASGQASVTVTLAAGTHTLVAIYDGDVNDSGSNGIKVYTA